MSKSKELFNQFGEYKNWTDETLALIAKDNSSSDLLLEAINLGEISSEKGENESIDSMIFCIETGVKLSKSNRLFIKELERVRSYSETEPDKCINELEKLLRQQLGSDNLFSRLTAFMALLSHSGDASSNFCDSLVEEYENQILKDLDEAQSLIVKLDTIEGLSIIEELLGIFYGIQEFYFERYGKKIIQEKEEFRNKLEEISEAIMRFSNDEEETEE